MNFLKYKVITTLLLIFWVGLSKHVNSFENKILIKVNNEIKIAKKKCLENKGPFFFQLDTYRWREHCGPEFDNNLGYRTEKEFLSWKNYDPLIQLQKFINDKISSICKVVFVNLLFFFTISR